MAKKSKTESFVCTECGAEFHNWQGQCTSCKAWNTIKKVNLGKAKAAYSGFSGDRSEVKLLGDIDITEENRFSSGTREFDRVLGGGFVPGAVILLGGDPGAGKSTILLQVLCHTAADKKVLYVSGEESLQQIAGRAKRLGLPASDKVRMLAETSVERVCHIAEQEKAEVMVIDSIQVMHVESVDTAPGGVSQVRESAARLTRYAKEQGIVMLIVGHVSKDHSIAGPMTLSHIVDTQIMLSSTEDARYRMMRTHKNRFGAVNELGLFAMTDKGLKEVRNPSAIFLTRTDTPVPGSLINVLWGGSRPLLVEIQSLVVSSQLSNPRRLGVGIDQNRIAMILAVLTKNGIFTADQDVFVNAVGGIRVSETAADLAVALTIASSLRDSVLPHDLVVFGELGLSGEVRPISNGEARINEARKHGFTHAIVPKPNVPKRAVKGMKITGVDQIGAALELI